MCVLTAAGVQQVHHYTPLHYLPFIARWRSLLCKPSIRTRGFAETHFRSMSNGHDAARGFDGFAFLTLHPEPPILRAKLARGFPHVRITVPARAIEAHTFDLCRFNVAMTRQLRRNGKPGFPESDVNGRYYAKAQIPVARTKEDKRAMLARFARTDTMIEVLVRGDVVLTDETTVICFGREDERLATRALAAEGANWRVSIAPPPGEYPRSAKHAGDIEAFIDAALGDPMWRGSGLEFDRV